jgi:hypothetical protein
VVSEWAKSYTTNIDFLKKDTQTILKKLYRRRQSTLHILMVVCLSILDDTTNNKEF